MGWYKDISSILRQEPETWLAYLYGQQLERLPHLMRTAPRYSGLLRQLVKFLVQLVIPVRLKSRRPDDQVKFLAFAGTINQRNSLDTTIMHLRKRGEPVAAYAPLSLVAKNGDGESHYIALSYRPKDVFRALVLFLSKAPSLYKEVKSNNPLAARWYFAKFCSTYTYLCCFYSLLMEVRPRYVMVSNDHNAANRCLLAVAHYLKIETIYLQHASVSSLFPALRVNYALLDGNCALDIYRQCERNQPITQRNAPFPKVLLTGQKKILTRVVKAKPSSIGVALNALDDVSEAVGFITTLTEAGEQICVRWHPGQGEIDTKRYLSALSGNPKVTLSDPKIESISDFMAKIGWLIAGNSSIHLEAALSGVRPIYFELSPSDIPDYYGYVKRGLASSAKHVGDILLQLRKESDPRINQEAVRYYSDTYLTCWEGKEGELAAHCLAAIARNESLPIEVNKLREDAVRAR